MPMHASIRSAVASAVHCGDTSSYRFVDGIRAALESAGFRFDIDTDGRLHCLHTGRLNGMPTPADLRIVRSHKAAILATFAG